MSRPIDLSLARPSASSGEAPADVPARPPLSEMGLILILGALAAFGPLAVDMYLPAFSSIAADLGTSSGAVGWTLAVYFVGLAAGQVLIGPITDRIGRTRPLRVGLAIFCLGSLAAALSSSIELLIAARVVQSLGGAACAVTSRAMVRDLYRGAEASRINSRLVLVMGIAPIVAPLLGGALLELAGWRAIFVALAALAALAYAAVHAALPETAPPRTAGSSLALLRALLFDRGLMAFALVAAASSAGLFAYITGAPTVFIEHHRVSPQDFGWFFGANAAAYVAASQLNVRLLRTHTPLTLLIAGVAASFIAALLLAIGAVTDWGLWPTAASCCAFLASLGMIMPNAVALALESQEGRAGGASAWIGALQFGAGGLASAAVSARHDGTALAMATTILGLALIAGLALMAAVRATRRSP